MTKWKKFKEEFKSDWDDLFNPKNKDITDLIKRSDRVIVRKESGNKRNFVRMNTFNKLEALLIITGINEHIVTTEEELVVLKDISANGIAILTDKYIDLTNEIQAKITFKLLDNDIILNGKLVRLEYVGDPFDYLYGIKCYNGNYSEDEMFKLLIKAGVQFKNVTVENSSIWKEYRKL